MIRAVSLGNSTEKSECYFQDEHRTFKSETLLRFLLLSQRQNAHLEINLKMWHLFKCLFIYFESKREGESARVMSGMGREGMLSRLQAVSTELDSGLDPTNCEMMT